MNIERDAPPTPPRGEFTDAIPRTVEYPNSPIVRVQHGSSCPGGSFGGLPSGQPYFFDVEPALDVAQHGVVYLEVVAQADQRGAFVGEQGQALRGW